MTEREFQNRIEGAVNDYANDMNRKDLFDEIMNTIIELTRHKDAEIKRLQKSLEVWRKHYQRQLDIVNSDFAKALCKKKRNNDNG